VRENVSSRERKEALKENDYKNMFKSILNTWVSVLSLYSFAYDG
jgi:hypothetical protein